jgi:hypothetical protein
MPKFNTIEDYDEIVFTKLQSLDQCIDRPL